MVRRILVFHGVCASWVFFRARTFDDAIAVFTGLANVEGGAQLNVFTVVFLVGICMLGWGYMWITRGGKSTNRLCWWFAAPLAISLLVLFGRKSEEFIYFVF